MTPENHQKILKKNKSKNNSEDLQNSKNSSKKHKKILKITLKTPQKKQTISANLEQQ